jgi:MFS family permease
MRLQRYIQAILVIVVLRAADLYITYLYTPDLAHEWNPLVSFLGVSWKGFIFTQICIVGIIALLMFYYFNRKPLENVQKGLSFVDFMYVYLFGTLKPWPDRLFSVPKNRERHMVFNGFTAMVITMMISAFAVINNLLLVNEVTAYINFVAHYYFIYFPLCFMVSALFSLFGFFGIEFSRYKRENVERPFSRNIMSMNESCASKF